MSFRSISAALGFVVSLGLAGSALCHDIGITQAELLEVEENGYGDILSEVA